MALTPGDYTYRQQITGTSPASTNSGQLLLITEASVDSTFWSNINNGGGALRVCEDSAGTTQLPLHVITCNTVTEKLVAFTRRPTYSSGSRDVYVFAKTTGAAELNTATYGRNNVWQDCAAAYPTSDGVDSTGNGFDLTVSGGTRVDITQANGVQGWGFNGTFSMKNTSWTKATYPLTFVFWQSWNPSAATQCVMSQGNPSSNTWDSLLIRSGFKFEINTAGINRADTGTLSDNILYHNIAEIGANEIYQDNVLLINGSDTTQAGSSMTAFAVGELIRSGSALYLDADTYLPRVYNAAAFSSSHQQTEIDNFESPATFWTQSAPDNPGGGGPTYSLTLDAGAYSYTGSSVSLAANRAISIDAGSYAYTGSNVNLAANRVLTIDGGSYAYSGSAVSLSVGRAITLNAGNYSYSGNAAALKVSRKISIDSGSYSYAGSAVTLTYNPSGGPTYQLTLDPGVYNYTGSASPLAANRKIAINSANYSYTGSDLQLSAGRSITVTPGSYSISGQDVSLRASRAITIDAAVYDYSGYPVSLSYSGQIISLISGYSVEYKQDDITGDYKIDDVSADYEQDYITARFL